MEFMNKIGSMAKNIGDRAGDAVETTKLNAKIASEKAAMAEDLKAIGAFFYDRFAAGEPMPEEVLADCNRAKVHADAIAAAEGEIGRIKAEQEQARAAKEQAKAEGAAAKAAAAAAAGAVCLSCGVRLEKGARFCSVCGAKAEIPAPEDRPRFCAGCGAALEEGAKFCVKCGQKVV